MVEGVYVLSDGYPEYMSRLLERVYPLRADAESVIALGNLTLLGVSLSPIPGADGKDLSEIEVPHDRNFFPDMPRWAFKRTRALRRGSARYESIASRAMNTCNPPETRAAARQSRPKSETDATFAMSGFPNVADALKRLSRRIQNFQRGCQP